MRGRATELAAGTPSAYSAARLQILIFIGTITLGGTASIPVAPGE
jgi:hypothetical protein